MARRIDCGAMCSVFSASNGLCLWAHISYLACRRRCVTQCICFRPRSREDLGLRLCSITTEVVVWYFEARGRPSEHTLRMAHLPQSPILFFPLLVSCKLTFFGLHSGVRRRTGLMTSQSCETQSEAVHAGAAVTGASVRSARAARCAFRSVLASCCIRAQGALQLACLLVSPK